MLSINHVALARETPLALAGRSVYLDHHLAAPAEEAIEARPIRTTALDSEHRDLSETARPIDELRIAVGVRRDEELAAASSEPVERKATCSY